MHCRGLHSWWSNRDRDSTSSPARQQHWRRRVGRFVWLGIAASGLSIRPAAAATPGPLDEISDPDVWQPHFESWVERFLIARELVNARESSPRPDPNATYRAVVELTELKVRQLRRETSLPDGSRPRLAARGLDAQALSAARRYVKGEQREALADVSTPELARDSSSLHLRAQLLDELSTDASSAEKLATIQAYRIALSFDRSRIQAARARVRIAQIYLDLGFNREAAAALERHLEPALDRPYDVDALLTYIEAAAQSRQYQAALAAIENLPSERLRADQARWAMRRKADLHFLLEQFPEAASAYATLADPAATPEATTRDSERPDVLSELRNGFALLKTNQLEQARQTLRRIALRRTPQNTPTNEEASDAHGESPLLPLVNLLWAQVEAESERYDTMDSIAKQALARYLTTKEAPLLATTALEAQRLKGDTRRIPEGVPELVDLETRDPAIGLLSFRLELLKEERGEDQELIQNLAALSRRLPQGPVQALIHDEMAYRLLERVRLELSHAGSIDKALLDIMESDLSARQMNENGLLFALEAFREAGRMQSCARWARALREREVRPVRRGLGAWREVQCRRFSEEEPVSRQELTEIADSGTAGPFSLALAALAGEELLRESELESAIRIYERALESFPEPQIVGPVLIRLGELHAAASREGLSRRRLERGLGVTGAAATVTDPFRKVGYLALTDIVSERGDPQRLAQLLELDLKRQDSWWESAFVFLGQRAGIPLATPKPDGSQVDPFLLGMLALDEGKELRARLKEIVDRADPGSPTEPGTP